MKPSSIRSCLLVGMASLLSTLATSAAAVERISVATGGGQGNSQSRYVAISGDGRYVAFNSDASNLVAGDTNAAPDIFLRDRLLGTTTRISNKSDGSQSNAGSGVPNISGDGSRIVFPSFGQLLPNSRFNNCYLFNRVNSTMQLLDLQPSGEAGTLCDSVSIDYAGRRVAVISNFGLDGSNPGSREVYVRDLVAGTTTRISRAVGGGHANQHSSDVRISGDGSRVLFFSGATNLVVGDTNGVADVFMASSDNSVPIQRVNVGPSGTQASSPSVGVYVAGTNANGSILSFSSSSPSLPDWGEFAEDTLYLRLPSLNQTIALSIPQGNLPREGSNNQPDFDYSGRWLVFASTDRLYSGAEQGGIYVIDLITGITQQVSIGGNSGNVHMPRLSADGTGIVWYSLSNTQVPNDSNGTWDVFYAANPLWVDTPLFANGFDG